MRKTLRFILSTLFLLFFVFIVYKYIDFSVFFSYLKKIKPVYLFVAFIFYLLLFLNRVARFSPVIKSKKPLRLYWVSVMHLFLSKILPGKTGEITFVYLMNRYLRETIGRSVGALLWLRYLDILVVTLFFFLGSTVIKNYQIPGQYSVFLGIILVLQIIFLFITKILMRWTKKISIILPRKVQASTTDLLLKLEEFIEKHHNLKFISVNFIQAILSWLIYYIILYLILLAFNVSLNPLLFCFAATFSTISALIPISLVGQFGTFELGWLMGFVIIGMDKNLAFSIGLFANMLLFIYNAILALIGYIYFYTHEQE